MAERFWNKEYVFLDSSGNPRAFGKLYTYDSETSNPHVTFSNNGLTIENLNPIILNLAGRLPVDVFGDAVDYKATITNANGTDSITIDPLHGIGDTADASFTASIPGAVPTTVNLRLDKAPVNALTDFDAPDDSATDAYSALQAAASACVDDGQRQLYIPPLTYMLGHQLNLSNIPIMGDGGVSACFKALPNFPDASVLLWDDSTGGSGSVDGIIQHLRIDGNKASQSGDVAGIIMKGLVFDHTFHRIRIDNCSGHAVWMQTGTHGSPRILLLDGIRINSCDGDAFRVDAGKDLTFRRANIEQIGGSGFNFTGGGDSAEFITIEGGWLEVIMGHGVRMYNVDDVLIQGLRINSFGFSDQAYYGIGVDGSAGGGRRVKIDGGAIAFNTVDLDGNTFVPHASSAWQAFLSGGEHLQERCNVPRAAPYFLQATGVDVTVRNNRQVCANTMPDMFFTNTASIAGGVSRFVGPAAVAQSATQSDVRFYVNSPVRLAGIRADFTTNAGGSDTYTVTVYKNGSITTLTAVTAAGAGTISYTGNEVVQLVPGDYFTVQITASATATTIPANGMKLTIGVLA